MNARKILIALFSGRQLLMTLLIIVGAAFLSGLGVWQWNRHLQRAALNQRIAARMAEPPIPLTGADVDPEELDYRRVELRGVYDPEQEVLLRNRSYNGATGYHLLTPLRLPGGAAVLIDRGWIPLTASDPEARRAFAVPGEVTVSGVARRSQAGLAGPPDPPLSPERPRLDAWFRVDIERIEQQTGYPLLPVFVELQPVPGAPPALPQPSATSDLGLGSHLGYSIQWFSFAVILVVGYVALVSRSRTRRG